MRKCQRKTLFYREEQQDLLKDWVGLSNKEGSRVTSRGDSKEVVGDTRLEFKREVQARDINLKVISIQVVVKVTGCSTWGVSGDKEEGGEGPKSLRVQPERQEDTRTCPQGLFRVLVLLPLFPHYPHCPLTVSTAPCNPTVPLLSPLSHYCANFLLLSPLSP